MTSEADYDFIIVGAGIIGPALAVGLVDQGWKVLVVERDMSEPDRIVGELLQPGGVDALHKLGMEQALEGIDAVTIKGYEVIYEGKPVEVPYTQSRTGRGFHHGRFVMNLRKVAKEKGVKFLEATVNSVVQEEVPEPDPKSDQKTPDLGQVFGVNATEKKTGKKMEILAPVTIIADGITSKFRKSFTPEVPVVRSHFVGLILKGIQDVLPAPQHGHVVIGTDHQPILMYQIDSNETRILCDVQGPLPSISSGEMKEWLENRVRTHLPEAVHKAFDEAVANQKYRVMPSQFLPATVNKTKGLIMIGDAMNMRHPLTGGGMTVSFKDAVLLSSLLNKTDVTSAFDTYAVRKQLKQFYVQRRKEGTAVINILAMALYSLFAANDSNLQILQRGCFGYFQRGGKSVSEPVELLSGVDPSIGRLFFHFFYVAFYSVYLNFYDKGLVGFPLALLQVFTVIFKAAWVFLPLMYRETRWW